MSSKESSGLGRSAGEFAEHTTEAACACAVLMVQGQLFLLSAAHWVIALQTGLVAGSLATILIFIARITRPWAISVIVGAVTTIADYVVHSGGSIAGLVESVLTGLVAAALAFVVSKLVRWLVRRRLNR